MSTACRVELAEAPLGQGEHAGLTLARYLRAHKEMDPNWKSGQQTPEVELIQAVSGYPAGEAYRYAFKNWETTVTQNEWSPFRATLAGPLAIGLGNESPLEVGLTTHFTYGMPVIPGAAIKGLCRRGALMLRDQHKMTEEQLKHLFGWTERKSAAEALVTFFDAWYDPESVGGKPFHRDVVTVHHRDYYTSRGAKTWPTDFDDPIPVPFLVVKPGARFLFALRAHTPEWGAFALELLKWSLENLGAGAKTSAGYGLFRPATAPDPAAPEKPEAARAMVAHAEGWTGVTVKRDPSSGDLAAQQAGSTAWARGQEAAALFDSLPESAREQLKGKKKQVTADVEVERLGNQIKLKRITPKEGG